MEQSLQVVSRQERLDQQTITIHSGTNTLTFVNHPIPTLKIGKTSETGTVQGFSFTVYDVNGESVVSGETDAKGTR